MARVYKPFTKYSKQADTKIEKPEFINGLMMYGNRISKTVETTLSTDITIHTVPPSSFFFLTNCFATHNDAGAEDLVIKVDGTAILKGSPVRDTTPIQQSFNPPLRLNPNSVVAFQFGGNLGTGMGGVQGYEVDASLIPNFL